MTEGEACRNCRRPIFWFPGIGWLHAEIAEYAHESVTCHYPAPVVERP